MTSAQVLVVLIDNAGVRDLVRAADSVSRQSSAEPPALAVASTATSAMLESLAARLKGFLRAEASLATAVNAAAAAVHWELVLLVSARYRLDRTVIDSTVAAMTSSPRTAAAAPVVRVELADGTHGFAKDTFDLSFEALLADPSIVPPVLCIRRTAWDAVGGVDPHAGSLSRYELALRLAREGSILNVPAAVVRAAVWGTPDWPPDGASDEQYLADFRYVCEKHREAIENVMTAVLVRSEIGFGQLRDHHRRLVQRRDAAMAELDAVRAETAHLRAFLTHRQLDALDWGDFRRADPTSRDWGYDRGTPIDRRYIGDFLAAHSSDIRGIVLEIQEDDFTRRYGGSRVCRAEVLDLDDTNARATVIADLRYAPQLPSDTYGCVILTQTIHVIDDMQAVLREVHRILAPGGVVLATLPCASRVCLEYGEGADLWRVTPDGARVLFESVFGAHVQHTAYGNVLTNVAFMHGLACEELNDADFAPADPYNPTLVGVRARKPRPSLPERDPRGVVLLYHRIADEPDMHGLTISAAHFESQLDWLRRECHVVPLDDLLSTPAGDLPERAVALTFDDGYVDNLERAAPALQRFGMPATFFLTTRWLEEPGEYWWDVLERVLTTPSTGVLRLNLRSGSVELPLVSDDDRRSAHRRLHAALVHADLSERDSIVSSLREHAIASPSFSRRPMLADEVRELSKIPGMSIGAHTVNHLSLADQDAAVLVKEIEESRGVLERITSQRIVDFAYPYGAVSRSPLELVRNSCRWGIACDGAAVAASFDVARVPRIEAPDASADGLARLLRAAWRDHAFPMS
jgi:peptidoglycan/xylan/chitin deacetylase (PgdA/CDA1 family)